MTSHTFAIPVLLVAAGAGSACTPQSTLGTVRGRGKLMEEAGVASSCEGPALEEDRPFVVTWDGTDLAEFEALAQRDTVFVRYVGCSLRVLRSCKQAEVPGKFGSYGEPTFTSGSQNSVEITNQDELRARLPLGVARFGGRIRKGESLKLRYHVSGVAASTREQISRGELRDSPGCVGATHFVRAYDVGAFSLETTEKSTYGASASVPAMLGVEGTAQSVDHRLAHLGELGSCTSVPKTNCRVPVRLVLSRIDAGTKASAPATWDKAPQAPAVSDEFAAWQLKTARILGQARSQLAAGDPSECIKTLSTEPRFNEREAGDKDPYASKYMAQHADWLFAKAECLSHDGQCERAQQVAADGVTLQQRAWNAAEGRQDDPENLERELYITSKHLDRSCGAARSRAMGDKEKLKSASVGDMQWSGTRGASGAVWAVIAGGASGERCRGTVRTVRAQLEAHPAHDLPLGKLVRAQLALADAYCMAADHSCDNIRKAIATSRLDAERALRALGRLGDSQGLGAVEKAELERAKQVCAGSPPKLQWGVPIVLWSYDEHGRFAAPARPRAKAQPNATPPPKSNREEDGTTDFEKAFELERRRDSEKGKK